MFQLDFKSGISICDQIVNGVIKLKALGVMKADEQLPSVRALASRFSINPNTVQKAYSILENGGIVYSVKGKGSFISGDQRAQDAIMENAKNAFEEAVRSAATVGVSYEQMREIINELEKGEER